VFLVPTKDLLFCWFWLILNSERGFMPNTLTREELVCQLKKRVQSAHRKGLLRKIFETGPKFFGSEGYELRRKGGVETREHEPWMQGSYYTYWDYEVFFPIDLSGGSRLSIRSHDRSRYVIDEWVKVTLFNGDKAQVVLHAIQSDGTLEEDKQNPQVAGGWKYETYLPGPWEKWLNIEQIKKFLTERDAKLAADRERQKRSKELEKLKESISAGELDKARRFGLI